VLLMRSLLREGQIPEEVVRTCAGLGDPICLDIFPNPESVYIEKLIGSWDVEKLRRFLVFFTLRGEGDEDLKSALVEILERRTTKRGIRRDVVSLFTSPLSWMEGDPYRSAMSLMTVILGAVRGSPVKKWMLGYMGSEEKVRDTLVEFLMREHIDGWQN